MSVLESMMGRAKFLPDKDTDPLIGRDGLCRAVAGSRVDGHVKGARRGAASRPSSSSKDLAHAVLVHSTIAKGKITSIDTTRAEQATGCAGVITHREHACG